MSRNKSKHTVITFATILAVQGAMAANITPTTKPAIADYTRPISFEPNRGQTDKQVDFLARGAGYALFLSRGKAVMAFKNIAVRMSPIGANASPHAEALDPQSSQSNYFVGNVPENWHANIANYAKVRYRDVYPGVDLIYYGTQRQLEYDFVVAPGGDPNTIALRFDGAAKPVLELSGDLVMHTAAGELRWHKPIAYQEVNGNRQLVVCDYVRKSRQLGFKLAAYDRARPLIIDPVLEYSTYLGGSGDQFGNPDKGAAIAVDASGNAYVTGSTFSVDFPTKNPFQNFYKGEFNGTPNAFVAKFNAAGRLVYSTYLGGSGFFDHIFVNPAQGDLGAGIAVDGQGNAYVTGQTGSSDFPIKNAFQSIQLGIFNAFLTKLNAAGNGLVYSTYLGGNNMDSGTAVSVDSQGDAYVTGISVSPNFPTKNAFQSSWPGSPNFTSTAFLTKFDPAGTALVYSTYFGGSGGDAANGIAVDAQGHVFLTGITHSSDFPVKDAFQQTLKSTNGNAFVAKFHFDGSSLFYSTYLGGSGSDTGNAIAVDSGGNAYVTGVATSANFPLKNAFQGKLKSTNGNAFVTKFHSDGASVFYSTYLGGSGSAGDSGNSITVDSGGHPYVTGLTTSTDFPIIAAFQPKLGSTNGNAFVTKFHFDGVSLFYSSYLGGSGADSGNGIAVDTSGNAYVTGTANSIDFPIKNAFQDQLESGGNAFVTKISAN